MKFSLCVFLTAVINTNEMSFFSHIRTTQQTIKKVLSLLLDGSLHFLFGQIIFESQFKRVLFCCTDFFSFILKVFRFRILIPKNGIEILKILHFRNLLVILNNLVG